MDITFDQYQRYKNIQITVELIKKYYKMDKLSILEVGSNEQLNLEKFLPHEDITYSDLEIPQSMNGKKNFIKVDATDLQEIPDSKYDIVISSDVFEHIPANKREAFLRETKRTSKILCLHCFPFKSEWVKSAEIRTNEYYKSIFGKDHIWLSEHIENGLPDLVEIEKIISKMNESYFTFEHGDIMLWEEMTKSTFYSYIGPELISFQKRIDDFYKKSVFINDTGKNNYRKFLVISHDTDLSNFILNERKSIFNEYLSEKNFNFIYKNIQDMRSITNVPKYRDCTNETEELMEIYLDMGEGFNEDTKIIYKYKTIESRGVIDLFVEIPQDTKSVRFDPIEGKSVILNGLNISSNRGEEDFTIVNGSTVDKYTVFTSNDPQIIINNIEGLKWLKIQSVCSMFDYTSSVDIFSFLINKYNENISIKEENELKEHKINRQELSISNLKNEIIEISRYIKSIDNKLEYKDEILNNFNENEESMEQVFKKILSKIDNNKIHYETAIAQREDLTNRLIDMQNNYNIISNSTCWRITKPIRVSLDLIKKILKSNKYTCLFYKQIKYIKNNGAKNTVKKVKNISKYDKYIKEHILTDKEKEMQINTKFSLEIKFSIVVPLYNTPEKFLREMIDSCINQTYSNWELCLADGSDEKHSYVKEIVLEYAAKDERIKYKKLKENKGISENTNECIKMSSGDYIALFDHDDILEPSVLYEYMKAICEKNADFIYCDEDKFEDDIMKAYDPYFKPDFAIDNLRTNNYICHFTVFKKGLLDEVGLFRSEFDGSQDHDMILRLVEKAQCIVHIPKVLYHWRVSSNSVASDPYAKPYTIEAGIKAVSEHLKRCNLKAVVKSSPIHPNIYRIQYDIIGTPLISILIPNKDHIEDLSRCINSILEKSTYKNYEIIIIENNSTEKETFDYYEKIQKYENIKVIKYESNGKFNYSAINNFGVKFAKGEHLLFLNNDIEVISENWIEEMLMYSQRNDVGAVGAKLYYPNNTIQHSGVIIGIGGVAGHSHKYYQRSSKGYFCKCAMVQNYSAVTAACLMMRAEIFKNIDGFDESFEVAFNDVDLCMRIRKADYLIVCTPYAELYHYESISRGLEDTSEKQARFRGEVERFQTRWKKELEEGDPYYNLNLTLEREDYSIK